MIYTPDAQKLADAIVAQLAAHPAFGHSSLQHAPATSPAAISVHAATTSPVAIYVNADRWTQSLVRQHNGRLWFQATPAQVQEIDNHTAIAGEMTRALVELQDRRHRTASLLGMSGIPGATLDPLAITVDRASGVLLTSRGVDPAGLVIRYRKYETEDVIMAGAPTLHVRVVSMRTIDVAVRDGHEAPILECKLRVGQTQDVATLFGNVLTLDTGLPRTLSLAASGRRLGDIVATRVPMLDERRIVRVDAMDGRTRFVLEPDLITIGEARRAAGYR